MDQVQTIVIYLQRREVKMECHGALKNKGNEYHIDLTYAAVVEGQGETEVYELEKPIENFRSPEEAFEEFLREIELKEWDFLKIDKDMGETLLEYEKQMEIVKKIFPNFSQ